MFLLILFLFALLRNSLALAVIWLLNISLVRVQSLK